MLCIQEGFLSPCWTCYDRIMATATINKPLRAWFYRLVLWKSRTLLADRLYTVTLPSMYAVQKIWFIELALTSRPYTLNPRP